MQSCRYMVLETLGIPQDNYKSNSCSLTLNKMYLSYSKYFKNVRLWNKYLNTNENTFGYNDQACGTMDYDLLVHIQNHYNTSYISTFYSIFHS